MVTIGTFLMKPTYEATSLILLKIGRETLHPEPIFGFYNQSKAKRSSNLQLVSSEALPGEVQYVLSSIIRAKHSSNFFTPDFVSAAPVKYKAHFTGAATSPKASRPRQSLNSGLAKK
jgi:hypothetical protein